MLAGLGICSFPLTWDIAVFSVVTSLVPAACVDLFPGRWWLPALGFSVLLSFPLLVGVAEREWYRAIASLACVLLAFGSSWLFKPRRKKMP